VVTLPLHVARVGMWTQDGGAAIEKPMIQRSRKDKGSICVACHAT